MKGFLVVDRLNDIHFIDTDKEFARHINQQAKENGLLSEDTTELYTVDPNVVMQHFSPLFMSQWFMIDHSRNPCSSITCDNNCLFVFKHFDDFLIVAINGDGTESEDFLERKALVFMRLTGFLLGPVSDEIGRPRFIEKSERWHYLRIMMSTWTFLAKNEQAFLVEAVEKLHMNQMVSEMCVDVLRRIVTRMQEAGETRTQHALLLVNSKLLSLYSNQNASELQASDVLCIIIIVRSLFPTHDRLEDLFAQSYRPIDGQTLGVDARSPAAVRLGRTQRERFVSAAEGFNTGEETENEQYYSAMEGKSKEEMEDQGKKESVLSLDRLLLEDSDSGASTPYPEVSDIYLTPTTSPAIMHDRMGMSARPGSGSGWSAQGSSPAPSPEAGTGLFRPRSHTAGEVEGHSLESKATGGTQMGNVKSSSFGELKKKGLSCSQRCLSESRLCEDVVKQEVDVPIMPEDTDYVKQTVFLATSQCRWSPCQIHCRRLYPGIILVVLTEMPKNSLAPKLVELMQLFKQLISEQNEGLEKRRVELLYQAIGSQLKKVFLALRKAKGQLEKLCLDINKKWDSEETKKGFMSYLEQTASANMPSSLERLLKYLRSKLMEIFVCLYHEPRPLTQNTVEALTFAADLFMHNLGDYKDYLVVKAQRNITMTTYIEDFPGLVHFIYVNRKTNHVIAPALNITHEDNAGVLDATQLLKEKIWSMTSWLLTKLHNGYTMISAREGDYHFSYFIWFENVNGDPEVAQRPYRADCTAPPPGLLTGNFYKYFMHKCFPNDVSRAVHCNELFMMHVGLVNTQYIAGHCRQLAAKLYETAGDDVMTASSIFGS